MSNELREALAAANVTPLIQRQIDPVLLEYVRRYSPLVASIPTKEWSSTTYYFNQRTALAQSGANGAGGFITDGGSAGVTTSTYSQSSFPITLLQNVGSVTGFAQAVTRDLIGDLQARELQGATQGLVWDIENAILWGNAAATLGGKAPQFDGLDTLVSDFTGTGNSKDQASSTLTLAMIDTLIDGVETTASQPIGSDWMLVMSPKMLSSVAQLQVTNQRFLAPMVEVATGLNVMSYRDIPCIKSSFLSGRAVAGPTIASSGTDPTSLSGGTFASSEQAYYKVSAVMARFGETLPSVPKGGLTMTAGSTTTNTLTFTLTAPVANVEGGGPVLYKVYRGANPSSCTLVGIVDAFDTAGTAASAIVDTKTALWTNSKSVTATANQTAYCGGNTGVLERLPSAEDIYLIPRNENFLVRPYTRDLQVIRLAPTTSTADQLPFAIVSDTTLAVRGAKYLGRARNIHPTI